MEIMREEATLDSVPPARDPGLDAFEALVAVHAPAAHRVAVAIVGETLARELLDEAFIAAWRGLPRLREPARFGPWLHRILVSRGRALLRHRGSVREIPVPAWHEAGPVHAHDGMGAADARAVLTSTFASLAYDQRVIVALHYAAGLSLRAVGETLDVPVGTVRSRLSAALKAMRNASGVDRSDGAGSPWARPGSVPAPGSVAGAAEGAEPPSEDRMPPQQPHLEAFLESLAGVAVPADLAAAVTTHVREHPSRRPSLRLPILAAAAGLLVTVAVAIAAGWNPPFDILPGPQVTLAPVASPDASMAPRTPAPAEAWEWATFVGQGAEMVVDPTVEVAIGVTPDDVGFAPVLVLERRVVEGRTWVRIEQGGYAGEARFVWIPETIPSIAPTGYEVNTLERSSWLPCDTGERPTIEALGSLTAAQRLACFGGASFTIGPLQVSPTWDDTANEGTPDWLAGPITTTLKDPTGSIPVPIRVKPGTGITLLPNTWMSVEAHLDDPAAVSCVRRTTEVSGAPVGEPSDHVLWCRQQIVVTGYTEVPAPTAAPPTPAPYPTLEGVRSLLPDAPMDGRVGGSAAWTGSELVIWGGAHRPEVAGSEDSPADGAALDVATGTWRAIPVSPLGGRSGTPSAWTGREVLFWGGTSTVDARWLKDGAAGNPATNSWRTLPDAPLKGGFPQGAAWSGDRWYVASGRGLAAYDPRTDTWTSEADIPIGADDIVRMAWAGDRLVLLAQVLEGAELWTMRPGEVWVNRASPPLLDVPADGLVFDGVRVWVIETVATGALAQSPVIASWDPASGQWQDSIDAPVETSKAAAVWNGTQLVVTGAFSAAYEPSSGTWLMLPEGGNDRFREDPTVVWAGDRLIVWGGGWGESTWTKPDGWQLVWPAAGS